MLPGLSGIEVLDELRSDAELTTTPGRRDHRLEPCRGRRVDGRRRPLRLEAVRPGRSQHRRRGAAGMTLARRMWLASELLALLVAAAFAALIIAVSAQRDATEREARSKDVTTASLQLEKLVSDVETSFLGITPDAGHERSWAATRTARHDLPVAPLRARDARLRRSPPASARAAHWRSGSRSTSTTSWQPLIPIPAGDPGHRRGRALAQRGQASTPTRSGSCSASSATRRTSSLPPRRGRRGAARSSPSSSGSSRIGASTTLIILFGIVLSRSIGRPVRAVASGASRLAAGELAQRLPRARTRRDRRA